MAFYVRKRRHVVVCAMTLLVGARSTSAQLPEWSAKDALVDLRADGEIGNRGVTRIIRTAIERPLSTKADSMVAALVKCLDESDRNLQFSAATLLAIFGQTGHPYAGRLLTAIADSADDNLKDIIVSNGDNLPAEIAVPFLKRVARDPKYSDEAGTNAISGLSRLGDAGEAALRELHRDQSVVHGTARGVLNFFARRNFRPEGE